jgi:hypothetical protein
MRSGGALRHERRGGPRPLAAESVLHVTNGDSAAETLRETGLEGAVLPWRDVLHEGPLPACPSDRLRRLRARFLADCGWGSERALLAELERRDRLFLEALAAGRRVVLWFEHDLYDQLQLLQILALVDEVEVRPWLELVNVGAYEGRPDFHGLGELSAPEMASLWPGRRQVEEDVRALARRAWDAVRAPDPTGLERFLGDDTAALPFLGSALRRLLEELPETTSGLARGERQLLEALAAGPRRPHELFLASQAREEAPFEGDAWVWRRLHGLGTGECPLIAPVDGGAAPVPPPRGDAGAFAAATLALTDAGRAVLAGEADRVELLGTDRWLGGTHLRRGNVWRFDRASGRVVRDPRVD